MTGTIDQMPPAELFQTLNYNQKTGVLQLQFPQGPATVTFRNGGIVQAEYGRRRGKAAFFAILCEQEGRFNFVPGLSVNKMAMPELGMFMELLMEGLRKIDEVESV